MDNINTEILLAISASGKSVHSSEQVAMLTRGQLKEEEGVVFAVSADGETRYNGAGERLGASEVVNEFLDRWPHWLKS
ncbi:MAG: hypothetical protein Q7T53_09670 [Deltaproteobacteria bacterium]|nr:hypothetical protein [Deltaproteobacteria bacterium]